MGTGKCGKYQLACIRMSRINGHLCAALANLGDLLYIFQIQLRVDTLREHIVSDI